MNTSNFERREVPQQSSGSHVRERSPNPWKARLALLVMGAAEACATQAGQAHTLERQIQQQVSQSRMEQGGDVIRQAREVRDQALRMNRVTQDTIKALADTVEQHGNPEYAANLRQLILARPVGEALAEFRMEATPDVTRAITQAHEVFENVLEHRTEGADRGATAIDVSFGLTHLFQEGAVREDQTRAVLRSGLLTHEKDQYMQLASEMPQAQVDLRRTFNPSELAVFASYVDHLNVENYWGETGRGTLSAPGLTGGQVVRGQIPLAYAARLFTSIDAVGALSNWNGMSWGGAHTPSEQDNAQLVNIDLSLKLAEALALFRHDVALRNGQRVQTAPNESGLSPFIQQQGYAAWNVAPQAPTHSYTDMRVDSGPSLVTVGAPVTLRPSHRHHHGA